MKILENKEFKKFRRDPRQFFLDSKSFKIFSGLFRAKAVYPTKNLRMTQPNIIKMLGYEQIDFVGDNWARFPAIVRRKEGQDRLINGKSGSPLRAEEHFAESIKPILLLWGFSTWKMQFVTDYLLDYRVAFMREHIEIKEVKRFQSNNHVAAFVIWGCEPTEIIKLAAQSSNIPIWKMEDGFLRSFELGSEFTLPQSLVLDKTGMYYDARSSSDLELLLNTWDFGRNEVLLKQSNQLLSLFRSLKLSKYNVTNALREQLYLNHMDGVQENVILIVGQLESDASLVYGGCKSWTNERLIELAISENPDANIIYRPHPDETKKNKKHIYEINKKFNDIAIVDNEVPISEHFVCVERVYTLTSLAGFEALLHGVQVTVVGMPFYAGWGLTDDRQTITRRGRSLTIEQLFCIAYLVYPKYIANLSDSVVGLLSAMQQISAERELACIEAIKTEVAKSQSLVLSTKFWPSMVMSNVEYKHDSKLKTVFANNIPYEYIFNKNNSSTHNRVLAYLIAGVFESSSLLHSFLINITQYLDADTLKKLLVGLWEIRPSPARMEHWAKFCEDHDAKEDARSALEYLSNATSLPKGWGPYDSSKANKVIKLASFELRNKNFDVALRHYEKILLSRHASPTILNTIAQIAIFKFEYKLALDLYRIIQIKEPNWASGNAFLQGARLAAVFGSKQDAFIAAATGAYINPNQIALFPEDTGLSLSDCFRDLPFTEALACAAHTNTHGGVLDRATADISVGDFERAERDLVSYQPKMAERDQYFVLLSQAQSFQGKIDEASALLKKVLVGSRSRILYREAFRLATQANNSKWLESLLEQMHDKNIEVSEAYIRKAATVTKNVSLYYRSFRDMGSSGILKAYFGKRYVQSLADQQLGESDSLLVLAYFGPGDEIRWASLYPKMLKLAEPAKVRFTCDPRLYSLFSRSLLQCEFIPSKRTRNITNAEDVTHINALPGSDLFRHMDNAGWQVACQSSHVSLQLDLIGDIVTSHNEIEGVSYLIPDSALVEKWKNRIDTDTLNKSSSFDVQQIKRRVGICWRSSLQTTARNQYYLDASNVIDIIESFPSVDFYCLQYDDCQNERLQIEQFLPGRFKYFDDLDYYDDFENLSALMVNLDLVISTGTTIVELAGALGIKTFFISTTAESDWRYKNAKGVDVWQNSITHVKADVLNDKTALASAVIEKLHTELTI